MILKNNKKEEKNISEEYINSMVNDLSAIYSNKSSDEYKCKGDITKSPNYDHIELQVAQLSSVKHYPANDVTAMKDLFNALHRPIFAKMVTEYLSKPDERNIVFTAAFTVGYRLLIGELSRVYTSSEATDKGFVFKPDKTARRQDVMPFIRKYNKDIDKRLDDMIKRANKEATPVQEAATLKAIGAAADLVVGTIEGVFGFLNGIFRSAASLNPVSLISACLSRSYDKKVEKYEQLSKEYEAAQKAYDEYKKIPATQRKKRIEHNYIKMIEKYNIKMQNLKAQIDHYDLRAQQDSKDNSSKKTNVKDKEDNLPQSSSTVDTSPNKDDDNNSDYDF